jgi:NAD(P)-dependent dehydrogenase (short-subunit alcohol dehydrogenase family)
VPECRNRNKAGARTLPRRDFREGAFMFGGITGSIDLRGKVVAITGASAGVGRATARLAGRAGAKVALMARDAEGLESARAEVAATGATAIAIPLDVADAAAVLAAAERIERELGPIDVWINNAMVTVFSPVAELEPEEIRRVTEVTYLGGVHGTLAALRQMRRRGRGTIVQVGSALAYFGIPLQAPYCAAKHALRGFTDALRIELRREGSAIAVTSVHLPAVNTPQFDWARTRQEQAPRPVAPVYSPAAAARAVLRAAVDPAREYWIGGRTLLMILGNMLLPQVMDRMLAREAVEGQARDRPVEPSRRDNLFTPVSGLHRTEGAFGNEARPAAAQIPAPAGRLATAAAGALLVAGVAGLAVAAAFLSRGHRRPHRLR